MALVDVDAIVRKLVEVWSTTAGVTVLDGRDYSVEPPPRVVLVGYTGTPMPVVDVARAVSEGSLCDTFYDVTVRGTVVEWDGEEEWPAKRGRAQDTLTAMNGTIEANRSLDGLAYDAWLAPTMQWYEIADAEGNGVEVDFMATVQVFA